MDGVGGKCVSYNVSLLRLFSNKASLFMFRDKASRVLQMFDVTLRAICHTSSKLTLYMLMISK